MEKVNLSKGNFLFGGVVLSKDEVASAEKNGKKYVVHLNNGVTVEYKKQKDTKAYPGISGYAQNDGVTTSIYNISGAKITAAPNKSDDISLFGCEKCDVDLSDAYGQDRVALLQDVFTDKKSRLNNVTYSDTDIIATDTFTKTTEGMIVQSVSLEFQGRGTVKQNDLLK